MGILVYIGFVNVCHCAHQLSAKTTLFWKTRKKNSPRLVGTSNQLREGTDVVFKTIFNYLFFDLMDEDFGWYMNRFRITEMIIMIGVLLIRHYVHKFEFGTKKHALLDLRLFLMLRILPFAAIWIITTIY